MIGRKLIGGALAACLVVGAGAAVAEEVGKVGVDWLG
ncbi:MAG: CREA protein, partial [Mesorhizobium sp.]